MPFNPSAMLIGMALAKREHDKPHQALETALLPAMVGPPMVGIVLAASMAKRYAQPPQSSGNVITKSSTSSTSTGTSTGTSSGSVTTGSSAAGTTGSSIAGTPGIAILEKFVPHSFFPSFLGYTWAQSLEVAHLLRLIPTAHHEQKGYVVTSQTPGAGEEWHTGVSTVTLVFGPRPQPGS
jgi:hypothetical protein